MRQCDVTSAAAGTRTNPAAPTTPVRSTAALHRWLDRAQAIDIRRRGALLLALMPVVIMKFAP